ncbi:hypothetical protein KIPB_003619 [Kipferlia bialata]|uniref:Uncharacterized protein n=1 Tax=Kipferlia bialata TaxID=797122 RepID=A0A391NK53_9EUKA|nr:hypothetical protein KIPB_003619 [Kipferlia bialata]|eukprot:g3619.t1
MSGGPDEGAGVEMMHPPPEAVQCICEHLDAVLCVDFLPDVNSPMVAVSGGCDDVTMISNGADSSTIAKLEHHKESVSAVAFCNDGTMCASADLAGSITIIRQDGSILTILDGPDGGFEWLQWHPTGAALVAGAEDGTVWLWVIKKSGLKRTDTIPQEKACQHSITFPSHPGPVPRGSFSPTGANVVTICHEDSGVRLFDPRTGSMIAQRTGPDMFLRETVSPLCTLAVSEPGPGGAWLVYVGSEDGHVFVLKGSDLSVLHRFRPHMEPVECIKTIPRTPLVLTCSGDGSLAVLDMSSGKERLSKNLGAGGCTQIGVVPKSSFSYVGTAEGSVVCVNILSGEVVHVYEAQLGGAPVFCVAVPKHPESAPYFAAGGDDGCVWVFPLWESIVAGTV